jgi:hypothetical protein
VRLFLTTHRSELSIKLSSLIYGQDIERFLKAMDEREIPRRFENVTTGAAIKNVASVVT